MQTYQSVVARSYRLTDPSDVISGPEVGTDRLTPTQPPNK